MLTGIISVVMALAPSVIKLVEGLRGPKTGPQKADDVFSSVIAMLQALAGQPNAPAWLKSLNDDQIKAVIETLVQQMNANGELPKMGTATIGQQVIIRGTLEAAK